MLYFLAIFAQYKNIGPITDTGIIPLTSVMLMIGKQSSGKSTFLKILCFCRWMEKLIMVSDEEAISQYTHNLKFLKSMKQFLGLMTLIFHLQVLSVMKAIQSQSRWRIFSVMWRFCGNRSLKQSGIINDGGNDLVRLIDENKMIPAYYASSGVQSAMPKGRGDSMLVMTTHSPYILPLWMFL